MESDEHLLVSPARGRRDAGAGAGLCTRHGNCRARHGEEIRRGEPGEIRRGGRAHFVLCQRGHAVRHRNLQDARLRRSLGRDHARALRCDRSKAAAVPLRRAGQLAGADRTAAGEQRHPHSDRDAGGDAVKESARTGNPASGLERSAWAAAAVGPAMVAAHAANSRLRDRPPGVWRPVRRLHGDRRQGRGA